jgi:hypothetical protein
VQSVAAYQAGELTGWVEIDGTTDSKFYVSAPFAKNGAGSDYNISPQYVGDTPPVGFSMSVTSGGIIQATLPSIAGYVSAKINFALNAPAVGVTFPLAIDSTLVEFSTLKAKDSGGFIFQENGGTQIGSISDNSDFVFGKTAGGNAHTMYGRDGNPTGFQHTLNIRSSSAANSIFLNLGTYETGDYAWIQSLESDTGNPKPFKFWTGNIEAGGYSAAGGWTLGSGVGNAHTINGAFVFADNATSRLPLSIFAVSNSLTFFCGTGGMGWVDSGNTNGLGALSDAGAWTLGPSSGLTAGHNIKNSSDTTPALTVTNSNTAANSDGLRVVAGGTTGATAVVFGCFDAANTVNHFLIRPNSQIYVRTVNWGTGGTAIGVSGFDLTTSPSSRRYKENEIPLGIDSSKIYDIEVKEFDFIEGKGGSHDFGAIAEDVEDILPEIVWKEDGQPESIRESKMVWLLLEEMKKLSARLVALENKGV